MDIHRCRFVPYPAAAINAVAFSHPHLPTVKKSSKTAPARLAIGRSNGDIEIWNPLGGAWHQETVIHGGKDRSVDALVWMVGDDEELENGRIIHGQLRLFSIGYSSTVTEWDLEKGTAKAHASGQHGELWCLGLQPRAPSGPPSQKLVGGTVDGCLTVYSTEDDELRFQRLHRIPKKKNIKMICIAFQSRHVAIVGCSDSTIRVLNMNNGAVIKMMTLGRDLSGGAKDIIVWSVKCLSNGDIVSGDSTGQICIWDGKTFTQAQRIQGHTQDVLSLATSADGKTIISGGMDKRTALYRGVPGKASRWAKVWHRRYHSHDVKAMASFEGRGMSVVVTGGPDATPVVMPLFKSGVEHHRTLSHLPQSAPLCSAPKARLIVSWWEREVHIWRFQRPVELMLEHAEDEAEVDRNRKLLARVLIKGDSNIASAAISQDGSLLVVSTHSEVKAFYLQQPPSPDDEPRISKITITPAIATRGASSVAISPDGLWICLARGADKPCILKVEYSTTSSNETKRCIDTRPQSLGRLKRDISKWSRLGGLGCYDRQVTQIAFSADSKMLATADLAGYIDTWVLQSCGEEVQNGAGSVDEDDAFSSSSSSSEDDDDDDESPNGHGAASRGSSSTWIRNPRAKLIPKLPAAPVVLSFSNEVPDSLATTTDDAAAPEYTLLVITTSSELIALHPRRGSFTPWMRRIKLNSLPLEYRNMRDIAKGVIWQGPRIWIYGASFLFMIDTSVEPEVGKASSTALIPLGSKQGIKRKRGADTGAGNKMTEGALEPVNMKMEVEGEGKAQWIDIEMGDVEGRQDSSAEDDDSDDSELQLRRSGRKSAVAKTTDDESEKRRRWWSTFKYRPILGVVPLGSDETSSNGGAGGPEPIDGYPQLEVALVERPVWDMDMPARYATDDR